MPRTATDADAYRAYLAAESAIRDAIDALASVSSLGVAFSTASCIIADYASELHDEAARDGSRPQIGTVH